MLVGSDSYLPKSQTFRRVSVDQLPDVCGVEDQSEEHGSEREDDRADREDEHGANLVPPQCRQAIENEQQAAAPGVLPN